MADTDIETGWDAASGARLKQARLEADKSQSEVADVTKVRQPTISNWERDGPGRPDEAQLDAIEKLLGRSVRGTNFTDDLEPATDLSRWLRLSIDKKQAADGITINEIAAASGVSVPTIYNILNGTVQLRKSEHSSGCRTTSALLLPKSKRKPLKRAVWEVSESLYSSIHTTTQLGQTSQVSISSTTSPVDRST